MLAKSSLSWETDFRGRVVLPIILENHFNFRHRATPPYRLDDDAGFAATIAITNRKSGPFLTDSTDIHGCVVLRIFLVRAIPGRAISLIIDAVPHPSINRELRTLTLS